MVHPSIHLVGGRRATITIGVLLVTHLDGLIRLIGETRFTIEPVRVFILISGYRTFFFFLSVPQLAERSSRWEELCRRSQAGEVFIGRSPVERTKARLSRSLRNYPRLYSATRVSVRMRTRMGAAIITA
jgi:hypothetical protein